MTGDLLPDLRTPVPGPRSLDLGRRLARVESRNITRIDAGGPIFWAAAAGANVEDVDGNRFVDLTAGFGVAAAGHGNPAVASAVAAQASRLMHAMGDVQPAAIKVELLERLAAIVPGDLSVSILSADGSDAVESALKTAMLRTGRPGVIAFEGAYHGLGYGALAVTWSDRFRGGFHAQLSAGVRFAPFPAATPAASAGTDRAVDRALEIVKRLVIDAGTGEHPIGAVIVEPILGRGGIVVPSAGFLPGLRELCDELDLVLIFDEIYTGLGRTGRWFACEYDDVVPDILVLGKALAGGLPLSATIGSPDIMAAWPRSDGEAIHTSTFLGNPVTAAAALAHLREIEARGLVGRAASLGRSVEKRLEAMCERMPGADHRRGRGLMQALVLSGRDPESLAAGVAARALRAGVIVLSEGAAITITPPLVITERQLEHGLDVIEASLAPPERV